MSPQVMKSRLVIVHNNIDQHSSIGKLAMWATQVGLDADYEVIAVANDIDRALLSHVQRVPLHVPPAVFAYQWARALGTVKTALSGVPYDLFHTYQPQLTSIADTWHLSFLTRSAEQSGSFPTGRDPLAIWRRSQLRAVAHMEDRRLRRLSDHVKVLFPSNLMISEFIRLYGEPHRYEVLLNPVKSVPFISEGERREAKRELVGEFAGVVVGFLGGMEERKGGKVLADGVAKSANAFLLFGGSGSETFRDDRLTGRVRTVGYVRDLRKFLSACDVLAVPSSFDPFPQVLTDAAAHGVPSISTQMVGGRDEVLKYRAGLPWDGAADSFSMAIDAITQRGHELSAGAANLAAALSERVASNQLRRVWSEALEARANRQGASSR